MKEHATPRLITCCAMWRMISCCVLERYLCWCWMCNLGQCCTSSKWYGAAPSEIKPEVYNEWKVICVIAAILYLPIYTLCCLIVIVIGIVIDAVVIFVWAITLGWGGEYCPPEITYRNLEPSDREAMHKFEPGNPRRGTIESRMGRPTLCMCNLWLLFPCYDDLKSDYLKDAVGDHTPRGSESGESPREMV
eukprot:TRINITY_DN8812_c0_g1_i1.p1 TRINITY_DN8812_c0_g1~~TRINITY_DN8812_c0_g1_i1.p1  ORF type:complete len:191 (-),score=24.90 TRINITY_DN8812_c0_g1_i1:217-789(-)